MYWTEYDDVNMNHSCVQKYISFKNGINFFNFSCTGSHKRLWLYYVLCPEMTGGVFLVKLCDFFKTQVFMHSVYLSVCPSVHSLTLQNILQISWHLHMLFVFDIEWTVTYWKFCIYGYCVSTETHKSFLDTYGLRGKNF